MEDKKVCKKIIKRAKKHPDWYTPEEVSYAKLMKKADTRCLTLVRQLRKTGMTFGMALKMIVTLRKYGRKWIKLNH
jgi:hypothetical protein